MSDALMKKVSGTKVFDQTLPQVLPIAAHPVAAVAQASATLLGTHRDSWPHTRLLQQVTARIRAKRLAQHQISHHAPKTTLYRVQVTTNCVFQRQTLLAIPVTEVSAQWKDWDSSYWVYGNERKVYCKDYPQTCCWGCRIM